MAEAVKAEAVKAMAMVIVMAVVRMATEAMAEEAVRIMEMVVEAIAEAVMAQEKAEAVNGRGDGLL